MNLPNYQTVLLDQGDLKGIEAQLNKVKIEQRPLVINILHFREKQIEVLENLEVYFRKRQVNTLPYSVWIISNCTEYLGALQLKTKVSDLPHYYHFKSRPLNSKENSLYNKVDLKQKNIASIKTKEYEEIIDQYAKYQKQILLDYEELLFYKKTIQRIDIYYGKKRS